MPLTPSPKQREAIEAPLGPVLVVAGPGAGKTFCLIQRAEHLIAREGIDPHRLCALTFTNKAAREMAERVDQLLDGVRVRVGTFHRFCARLLRQQAPLVGLGENFSIYDTDDSSTLLANTLR